MEFKSYLRTVATSNCPRDHLPLLSVARQRRREVREGEERATSVRQAASPAILFPREAGETWAERYRARVCGGQDGRQGARSLCLHQNAR